MSGTYAFAKTLHEIGVKMIEDDASDLGLFEYYGRKDHYYHGVHSPDHPSPFHHWQWGGMLVGLSELIGIIDIAKQMAEPEEDVEIDLPEAKPVFFKAF